MIEGKTVRPRSIELSDVDVLVQGWNNMKLRTCSAPQRWVPCLEAKKRNWVRSTWKDKREKTKFAFEIEELKGKKPLDNLSLFNCN